MLTLIVCFTTFNISSFVDFLFYDKVKNDFLFSFSINSLCPISVSLKEHWNKLGFCGKNLKCFINMTDARVNHKITWTTWNFLSILQRHFNVFVTILNSTQALFELIQTTNGRSERIGKLSQSKSKSKFKSKAKSQKDLEWLYSAVPPPTHENFSQQPDI